MRKYLAEFIGTFALVFCGTGAIAVNQATGGTIGHAGVAGTFGLIVTVMIYAFGPVSGAHLNPAVTIAFAFARRFRTQEIAPYLVAQLAGALLASFVVWLMFPQNETLGATLPLGPVWRSFALEFIMTFFLMLVILQVSSGSKEQGMFAGIAIGATVLLEAMFAGPISGASMNPARSVAPAVMSGHYEHLWIYLTSPVLGALLAVFISNILRSNERDHQV